MDVLDYLYVNGREEPPKITKDTKTDVPGLYKTPSGAVISKDNESLKAYKLQKAKASQINSIKNDVDQLKNDMAEIKELLKGLVK